MKSFKYIDLFSGIGGFHQAMTQLGGECVFASEIDKYAIDTYQRNYKIDSAHDITKVKVEEIPTHDVLCAGFPCQTFSKAGRQMGFNDEIKGTLFFEIERILKYHKTKYIILENVRNLISHNNGNTWATIYNHLVKLGYRLTKNPIIISPHQIGIPQLRERVIILGYYDPRNQDKPLEIELPKLLNKDDNSIYSILEENENQKYKITEKEEFVLTAWDKFYKGIKEDTIGFPIWVDYFKIKPKDEPNWKKDFIRKNNMLYENNKQFIDKWLYEYKDLKEFAPTHRKMEWQAGNKIKSVWEGIIQFRPSGVRVKTPTCFPALVAMVQIPIIGKYKRRLSPREAARLQSFPDNFIINENEQQAYKQFGNSVNVQVIKVMAEKLFQVNS